MTPEAPRLMKVASVAKALRVGRDRVLSLVRRGELRAVNVGEPDKPCLRIDAQTLDEFLARRTIQPTVAAPRRRRRRQRREIIQFF